MKLNSARERRYAEFELHSLAVSLDDPISMELLGHGMQQPSLLVISVDRDLTETETNRTSESDRPALDHAYFEHARHLITLPDSPIFQQLGCIYPRDESAAFERLDLSAHDDVETWRRAIRKFAAEERDAAGRVERHYEPTGFVVEALVLLIGGAAGIASTTAVQQATSKLLERVVGNRRRQRYSALAGRVDEVGHKATVEASLSADVTDCAMRVYRHPNEPWIVEFLHRDDWRPRSRVEVDIDGETLIATVLMTDTG